MSYNHTEKECDESKKKYKQGFERVDRGLRQYLTEHDDSNDEANEDDTLDDFEALIISINDAQEPDPLENTEHFLTSFGPLTCDNTM